MIKVMICDDHKLFREGLMMLINKLQTFEIIGLAGTGEEVIDFIDSGVIPDILLLDINMSPGMNGYELTRYIKKNHCDIKILAISCHSDNRVIKGMIRTGADGFISKYMDVGALRKAISIVSSGGFYFEEKNMIDDDFCKTSINNKTGIHLLTQRELDVAFLMCTNKPYKEIAKNLKISPSTLENIRIRIFEKTESETRTEVAIFLMRIGLVN